MKKQMKRGAFSPYLKCRLDLYNSPDIQQLRHDKAAEGFGCLMVIALDLSRNSDGIGTWDMIGGYAQICRKSKFYIMSIIKDYGRLDCNDAIFVCKIVSRSFAIESSVDSQNDASDGCTISTRTRRADVSARTAQKDNDNHKEKENKEKGGKVSDMIGPSAYETVDRAGLRHGHRGELVPWWASPQTDIRCVWSLCADCWTTPDSIDPKAEQQQRQQMTDQDFMMKTAWETLSEDEQQNIQDHGRRI